jgi:hypothetical protein
MVQDKHNFTWIRLAKKKKIHMDPVRTDGRSSRFVTGADVQCSELVRISEIFLPET